MCSKYTSKGASTLRINSRRTNNNVDATPLKEKFEDTKVVIRSRNPKVKQCIAKEKDKNYTVD